MKLICLANKRCVDYTNARHYSMWHTSNDGGHLFLQIIRDVTVGKAVLNKSVYNAITKNREIDRVYNCDLYKATVRMKHKADDRIKTALRFWFKEERE